MAKSAKELPPIGDMVESNPNYAKLVAACKEFAKQYQATGEEIHWPQPKAFAEMHGLRDFSSDSFRKAYYKVRKEFDEGKDLFLSIKL
jgi:hypothetical protein